MFGNTNDIQNQTENNNTNEASWGGFGRRFSYEESQKSGILVKIVHVLPRIALGTVAFALLGMLGVFCAAMMYSIVSNNHSLYPEAETASPKVEQAILAAADDINGVLPDAQIMADKVSAENITLEQARLYCVPTGVLISELVEEDAAYSAGLRGGDIVVAIEGKALSSIEELSRAISENSGETVEMTLFRGDTYIKIYVSFE